MARVQVKAHTLIAIKEKIAAEQQAKQFRSTVVALIQCLATGKFLMIEARAGRYWAFPQGGVEPNEGVIDALLREVREETSIDSQVLTVRKFCLADQAPIENWQRDGYTHGKSYYYFHLTCETEPDVFLDEDEAVRYEWVSHAEAMQWILSLRARRDRDMRQKSDGMLFALEAARSP